MIAHKPLVAASLVVIAIVASCTLSSEGVPAEGSGGAAATTTTSPSTTTTGTAGGGPCKNDMDCPMTTACVAYTCTPSGCVRSNAMAGAPAPDPKGNCQSASCDGFGDIVTMEDDTDLIPSMDPCIVNKCSGGVPIEDLMANNGQPCGAGHCQGGVCIGCKVDNDCPATSQCKDPHCDMASMQCKPIPKLDGTGCSDGDPCTDGDVCQGGNCSAGQPHACPGDMCHFAGVCNGGACQNQPKIGVACDDGNACTLSDTCDNNGSCSGTQMDCPAPNPCYDVGSCINGACVNPPKQPGFPCDDNDLCTTNDVCNNGQCSGTPVMCPGADPDNCQGAQSCNPVNGKCTPNPLDGTPCDDGVGCQGDTCKVGSCSPGTTCNTPGVCETLPGSCIAGGCTYAPKLCANGVSCCAQGCCAKLGACDGFGNCPP